MPALLFSSLAGCAQLPDSAWQQLKQAQRDYDNRAYHVAEGKLDAVLKKYSGRGVPLHEGEPAFAAEAYYLRSLCYTKLSNKARAESDARHCLKLSKDPKLTARAHATLATLLYETNRIKEALPHFAEALKGLPEKPPTDLLRYRFGLCLQRENHWKEARLQFAAVFQRYPKGSPAQHAKRLYDWTHDYYSIQCGAFREKGKAAKLERRLKRAGLPSRVESLPRSGELLYMVYVGQYPRYEQARDALSSVQRHISDAIVMPQ